MKSIIFLLLLSVTALSAQTSDKYVVSGKTLNVRAGNGKEYEILFTLNQDDQVTVLEKYNDGWWKIDYEGVEGYAFSTFLKKDPHNGWNKRQYESGETPECENIIPEYDSKLDNYLRINVGSHTDVVVKLMKKSYYGDDVCIRIVYIRSNETYLIKNIPEGVYYVKIAYGKDWRQKIVESQCYGKFMKDAEYSLGKERLDYNIITTYNRQQIPSYELTLDMIVTYSSKGKTFKKNSISEVEFNK